MRPWRSWLSTVALALMSSTASAQTLTGAIAGTVKDPQGAALPGASVWLVGRAGTARVTTDRAGDYRFPAIDPGSYALRIESSGFKPQQRDGIRLHPAERLTIDCALSVAGLTESVDVVAETPVVDVRSSSFRIGLTQEQLFNIPLSRNASALQDATPGINQSSAFGATINANALYLDGVDTRSPEDGTGFVRINYNLLEEVQVQGPGAPAEYGAFTGAVVNAVTRSGGNRLEGLFETRYSARGLASNNVDAELVAQNPTLADPEVTTKLLDLTGQVGGPIQKDKLFFLVNAQRSEDQVDPSGPRTSAEILAHRWTGKLTWNAGPRDHAALSLQHDDNDARRRGVTLSDTDALTLNTYREETIWNAQWRRLFGKGVLESRYVGWTSTQRQAPQADVPGHRDVITGQKSGSAGFWSRFDATRHQASVSLSRYAEGFGRHDLKFGVEIERGRSREQFGLPNGLYYFDKEGQPYLATAYGFDTTGLTHRESVYAQDAWRPSDRLTFNLGTRLDLYQGQSAVDTVYRARGLAPRLGVAWDVGAGHRSVLRASYGVYYETLPYFYFWQALPGIQDEVLYDTTGSIPVAIFRTPHGTATVDPRIRHPRVQELAVGFERALPREVRLSVTGLWRRSSNIQDDLHPGARYEPLSVANPLTGQALTVYRLANPSVLDEPALITNVDGLRYLDPQGALLGTASAYRKYRGLMLVASRRLAGRWQAQASYVLAKADGTVDNSYDDGVGPFGGSQNYTSANWGLVNTKGPLTFDFRHELKLLGSYRVPGVELGLNAYFLLVSGYTYTPLAQIAVGPDATDQVPLEPRGNRRLPHQAVLNVRVERAVEVGRGRVGFYVDVTNLFNANTATSPQDRFPSTAIEGYDQPILLGAPLKILPPRQTTLGARWTF